MVKNTKKKFAAKANQLVYLNQFSFFSQTRLFLCHYGFSIVHLRVKISALSYLSMTKVHKPQIGKKLESLL